MDSNVSEERGTRPVRRSARLTSGKAVKLEVTPRGPLKRTKKRSVNEITVAAVNGSRDKENDSEDEESPRKKRWQEKGEEVGQSGDESDMEVQESAEDKEDSQELEMDMEGEGSPRGKHPPDICLAAGDVRLSPLFVVHKHSKPGSNANKDANWIQPKTVKTLTTESAAPTKSDMESRSLTNTHHDRTRTMDDYKATMKAKLMSSATSTANHIPPKVYPTLKGQTQLHSNNNQFPKRSEYKKPDKVTKKTANTRTSTGYFSRGNVSCLVILLLLVSAALLTYKKILQRGAGHVGNVSRDLERKLDYFESHFPLFESQFPSQRPDLWTRSKIHLGRHLKTAQPTEPVSLILTAGSKANKTLRCLASRLASSFSSALNGSVLHIDGASKGSQNSDEVKLYIDSQLKEAFEGDKPVAVIHHLEELPPGSTLIFYRYCDHESAAYKQVFLLFTVLLPQDEISSDKSLKDVEEMVQDYVKERLVGSSSQTSFNDMDIDKYGGLWSRISHLILPVVSEEEVEQKGC
ncbi:torsin-1A-interacting protein 2-like isoform X2 [Echeneis naucrates]|uniref:torsin-1A-interacting protein 2-like isoform X2 n=1 Tax=Echeneis naucrates TaxID=173247 RepID=UPI0011145899|nr:torsin-1A-interacting protein 2-like isoform X2 [Echeneis naucrates]